MDEQARYICILLFHPKVEKQTYVSCFAPIDLTKLGSDLAQNCAEFSGNEGHNSTDGTKLAKNGADLAQNGTKMGPTRPKWNQMETKSVPTDAKAAPKSCLGAFEVVGFLH